MITIIVDDLKEKNALLNMSKALDNFELEVKGLGNGLIVANYGTGESKTIKKDGTYTLDINNEIFDFICKLHKNPELILVGKEIIEAICTDYDNKNIHEENDDSCNCRHDENNSEKNIADNCNCYCRCVYYDEYDDEKDEDEDENTYK